eukprot:scaffold34277_cov63-Phaeocystis_antarctica.AAC.6
MAPYRALWPSYTYCGYTYYGTGHCGRAQSDSQAQRASEGLAWSGARVEVKVRVGTGRGATAGGECAGEPAAASTAAAAGAATGAAAGATAVVSSASRSSAREAVSSATSGVRSTTGAASLPTLAAAASLLAALAAAASAAALAAAAAAAAATGSLASRSMASQTTSTSPSKEVRSSCTTVGWWGGGEVARGEVVRGRGGEVVGVSSAHLPDGQVRARLRLGVGSAPTCPTVGQPVDGPHLGRATWADVIFHIGLDQAHRAVTHRRALLTARAPRRAAPWRAGHKRGAAGKKHGGGKREHHRYVHGVRVQVPRHFVFRAGALTSGRFATTRLKGCLYERHTRHSRTRHANPRTDLRVD